MFSQSFELNKSLVFFYKKADIYFGCFLFSLGAKQWVDEFAVEQEQHGTVDDQWVNEFSKLHVNDWVEEFGQQVGDASLGDTSADSWVNAYDE